MTQNVSAADSVPFPDSLEPMVFGAEDQIWDLQPAIAQQQASLQ